MRDFNEWLSTFSDNLATWNYYADFEKAYNHTDKIKDELNILNGLIGSKDIENEFKRIVEKYPSVLEVVPILIAKREHEIKIVDSEYSYIFNFKKPNYSIDDYSTFMRKSGLYDLLENHIIHSLVDYVLGVEVGMDTNGRKNRTGDAMEDLVESYLLKNGFVKNDSYYKELTLSSIEKKWGIDLSAISNTGKSEKRFDFVVKTQSTIYGIEVNYYTGGGSKLNETARSYKTLALESKDIKGFSFVWFTDGKGWHSAKHNLEETFDVMPHIYNINDLKNGIISEVLV
ncbi:MAG: type II restriction endonuclease [Acutalibacteraceae bacterium]